jgi:Mycobacterium membrane protein
MSDPRRPEGSEPYRSEWSQPTEPLGNYPPYTDPAYAGQQYTYPAYTPPTGPNPTEPLPPYWTQTQYQPGELPQEPPPPGGPKSPRWLWLVAAAAVLLVVGLVVALLIANGSSKQETVVSPLPPLPETPSATPTPTTTTSPSPSPTTTAPITPPPTESTQSGPTQTVVYNVTGEGRAISIAYVDTGGVLQTEFNVVLPWSKEVSLSSPASRAASVTIVNIGGQVTCSVTVDGAQVSERTGSVLTVCAALG